MPTISVDVEIDIEEEVPGLGDCSLDKLYRCVRKERAARQSRRASSPDAPPDLPDMDPERVWSALRWLRRGSPAEALAELEAAFASHIDTARQEKLWREHIASRATPTQEIATCA
jgi:hypothetical protein